MGQIKSALSIDNPPKTVGAENHSEQWWMAKCSRDGKCGWNWGQQIPPYSISYFLHKLASELRSCLGRLQMAIKTSLWAEVAKCTTEKDCFGINSGLLMTRSRVNYSGLKLRSEAILYSWSYMLHSHTQQNNSLAQSVEEGCGEWGGMGCIGGGQRWEVCGLQWMDFLSRRQRFPCTACDLQPRLTICVSPIMHMQTCRHAMAHCRSCDDMP